MCADESVCDANLNAIWCKAIISGICTGNIEARAFR